MNFFNQSKTTKDVQWAFISLIVSSFSHLLLRILIGRDLGPDGLGIYTLVFTIYLFGMQFAAFGVGEALTKYVAEYADQKEILSTYVSSSIAGSLFSGTVMGIVLYIISYNIAIYVFHIPEMTELLKITSLCFPFIALQKATIGTLNGMRKMNRYATLNIAQNLLVLITTIFLVKYLNGTVNYAIYGFVFPTILIGIFAPIFIQEYIKLKYVSYNMLSKEIAWFGFYAVLANSIVMINNQMDSLMLGYFLTEVDVGIYAVAAIIVQSLDLLPRAIQRVTTPIMTKYYSQKKYTEIWKTIKKTSIQAFLTTLIISIFIVFTGRAIIYYIFGQNFILAYSPLLILLIGYLFRAPYTSISNYFASTGRINIVFKLTSLSLLLNMILNYILIPHLGINGAAIATTTSLMFDVTLKYYLVHKYANGC